MGSRRAMAEIRQIALPLSPDEVKSSSRSCVVSGSEDDDEDDGELSIGIRWVTFLSKKIKNKFTVIYR